MNAPARYEVRRATPDDAPAYARIMGDPEVYPGLMQMPFGNETRLRAWLAETTGGAGLDTLLVALSDGEIVGSCGLHPAHRSPRRRHAFYFGTSVPGEWQGRGVGSALMVELCNYADNWLAALRLELTVFADNAPAIALYRKFGFVVEGTFRDYALRHGRYEDVLAMVRFHPRPPSLNA